MCRLIFVFVFLLAAPASFVLAQISITEKLHGQEEPWLVTDATGNEVNLVGNMQPGQVLLVMPVDRNWGSSLDQLAPLESVLDVLGENGTQELSIALIEISGHNLLSDSWASGTSIPIYSSSSATLTPLSVGSSASELYTTIQKLQDGTFIEARRNTAEALGYNGNYWWSLPLFRLLFQAQFYYTMDFSQESFLTTNAGFPALDESWCAAVGCQVEDLNGYELGAGAGESNPELWKPWNGLVGTSEDGTIVQDPTNPENLVLEIKSDSINGDVAFANKHLHVFADYEIEFDIMRREGKGAFLIAALGEYGNAPNVLLGEGLGYEAYAGRLYVTEDGGAHTWFYEPRGLDLNLTSEVWHHVKIGFSIKNGYFIEVDGTLVYDYNNPIFLNYPKLSGYIFWSPEGRDVEFLVDNVFINPIYRKDASDFGGCRNINACNYNLAAPYSSETTFLCVFPEQGRNCDGECLQDSNNDGVCDDVVGCTEPSSPVFDPVATIEEECCTAFEHTTLNNAETYRTGRLLRQSAWSLSRVVVTGPSESDVWFDSDDGGLEEFQSDDSYLFQLPGANSLSFGGNGSLQYDNNYVTQNHLLNYAPEFGTYSNGYWYVSDGCAAWDNLPGESEMLFIGPTTSLFYPNVTPSGLGAEARPCFLGTTDSQGYECSPNGDRGFGIKTINDSLLVLKSPLADQSDKFGLITLKAEPHSFPFCILGCTDPEACNYESFATYDDGTCHSYCESGCTNEDALNYNPDAVIDDGSCEYFCGFASLESALTALESYSEPGLLSGGVTQVEVGTNAVAQNAIVVPENFINSAGTGFPVAWFTPTSISGLPAGLQTSAFPNFSVPGLTIECIVLEGIPTSVGVYNVVVEGDLSVFFGTNEQDFGSFQYNWVIEVTQGTEPILGCTYPDASNFVSYADDDDGSCLFDLVFNPCPADFDDNGEVGTSDLLDFLAYFGEACE